MVTRTIENFELSQICDSGQCFRMERKGEGIYSIIAADKYLEAEQHGNECIFYCGEDEFEDFWKGYFDLGKDYACYISQIDLDDSYLNADGNAGRDKSGKQTLFAAETEIRRAYPAFCQSGGGGQPPAGGV